MITSDDMNSNNNSNNNENDNKSNWVSSTKTFKNHQFTPLKQRLDSLSINSINEIIVLRISIVEINAVINIKVDRDSTVKDLLHQILKKKRLNFDNHGLYLCPNLRVEYGMWLDESKYLFLYDLYDQDLIECKKKKSSDINQFQLLKIVFPEQMKSKTLQVDKNMLVKDATKLIQTKLDILAQINQEDIEYYGLYSLLPITTTANNNYNYSVSSSSSTTTTSILMNDNNLLSSYSNGGNINIIEFKKKEVLILSLHNLPTIYINNNVNNNLKSTNINNINNNKLEIPIKSTVLESIYKITNWLNYTFNIKISNNFKLLLLQLPKLWLIDNNPIESYNIKKNDLLYLFSKITDNINEEDGICLKVKFSACLQVNNVLTNSANRKLSTLPGELLVLKIDNVIHLTDFLNQSKFVIGDIYLTNYQLIFLSRDTNKEYNIHLGSILKVEKVTSSKSNSYCYLDLICKDFRYVRFLFKSKDISRKKLYETLKDQCFHGLQRKLFAYYNKEVFTNNQGEVMNGWNIYNAEKEYKRLGITQHNSGWRITKINMDYQKCETYPQLLVVPETVSDEMLVDVFIFRSKGRIPVLSWRHQQTNCTITRCAQPLVGLTRSRCIDDEYLVKQISSPDKLINNQQSSSSLSSLSPSSSYQSLNFINQQQQQQPILQHSQSQQYLSTTTTTTNNILQSKRLSYYSSISNLESSPSNIQTTTVINGYNSTKVLNLLDARPKMNANVNKAMGAGFENTTTVYSNCILDFLNIANIHVMRDSYEKLKSTCFDIVGGIPEYIPKSRESIDNLNLDSNNINNNNSINNINNNSGYNNNNEIDNEIIKSSTSQEDLNSILNSSNNSYFNNNNNNNNIIDNNIISIDKYNYSGYYSGIDSSKWFEHLMLIMSGSVRIVDSIVNKSTSVLIHCSDGWDRTSQLSSLSLIMLDSYYRTIEGFIVVIEKEWLSFGHKFDHRTAQVESSDERSPVFLQFIECVYHITLQFQSYFEFNERFLIEILTALYSNRFGTFLYNSEKERLDNKVKHETQSLWSFIYSNLDHYTNINYFKGTDKVIIPSLAIPHYSLWKNYYLKNILPL